MIFANVRLGSKAAVSCQGNRAGECKPGLILGIVFDTAPGIAETIELLIDSRWGSNSMTKKRKPKWDYAVLYPKPFNFDEAQLAEIREHVLSAADVSADHIKEFLTTVEDEIEGYNAYKIIEDTQPTIAEIRAAISEIEAITQGTLDRLGAIDSSSRRIWAPHLDHSLFTQMEGLTVSPDFYLRNDFRDNIDVTKRLLNNILASLRATLETIKEMRGAGGGRPPKEQRRRFILQLTKQFETHLHLTASGTDEGAFESLVKICLKAANDPIEDVHKEVRHVVRNKDNV